MPDYSIKRIIDWYTKKLKECKGAFVSVSIDDLKKEVKNKNANATRLAETVESNQIMIRELHGLCKELQAKISDLEQDSSDLNKLRKILHVEVKPFMKE
jgi:hypothetical protein